MTLEADARRAREEAKNFIVVDVGMERESETGQVTGMFHEKDAGSTSHLIPAPLHGPDGLDVACVSAIASTVGECDHASRPRRCPRLTYTANYPCQAGTSARVDVGVVLGDRLPALPGDHGHRLIRKRRTMLDTDLKSGRISHPHNACRSSMPRMIITD